ncbi:MAG: glycosyltransferase family 2 protein [Pseudomonadota bacterium]
MTITVLIPAHNEASVIARCLTPLAAWAAAGKAHVVVIANACDDETFAVAKSACPAAIVLETPVGGKTNALNLAMTYALDGAVLCLDADLVTTPDALEALAAPLMAETHAGACGRMEVSLDGVPFWVRQFYAGWLLNPYQDAGKFGGLFGVSAPTARALFPLPKLTADDEYIARFAEDGGIAYRPECAFTVQAPRKLADLIRIRRRSYRGTKALTTKGAKTQRPTGLRAIAMVAKRGAAQPKLWLGVLTYIAVSLWVRVLVAFERTQPSSTIRWERDASSRLPKEI